jgi:predicted secreted Zn-dependent protease
MCVIQCAGTDCVVRIAGAPSKRAPGLERFLPAAADHEPSHGRTAFVYNDRIKVNRTSLEVSGTPNCRMAHREISNMFGQKSEYLTWGAARCGTVVRILSCF